MNINEALNLLNLSGENITKEQIKKAYKKAAIKYHPDRNPASAEVMKAVNAAFEFLSNLNMNSFNHTENEKACNFAEELEEIITELQKLQGVIIEVCGNWIWLSGETKQHKEALKELGCFWASKKKSWYYRPAGHKSKSRRAWEMDEIRNKYGSSTVNYGNNLIRA